MNITWSGAPDAELAEQPHGAGQVVEVVERELPAVELLDPGEQVPARAVLAVVRGVLVRVLAVREVALLREREREACRELLDLREPGRDRRVVGRRRRERLRGEAPPRRRRRARLCLEARRARARTAPAGTTGTTCAKFFAAPRSSDGPPTSISSTASASVTPRRAVACSNGYRLTHTRSNGAIPCSSSVATSSARSRRARIPAWMRGCSVFTRPPSSSGTSVSDSTAVTSSPSSSRYAAVPPLATSSHPSSGESLREDVEAGLVEGRDQRAHSSPTTRGSSRCSTAWIRSTSVSRGSTGTGAWARIGPESRPSSTT